MVIMKIMAKNISTCTNTQTHTKTNPISVCLWPSLKWLADKIIITEQIIQS